MVIISTLLLTVLFLSFFSILLIGKIKTQRAQIIRQYKTLKRLEQIVITDWKRGGYRGRS